VCSRPPVPKSSRTRRLKRERPAHMRTLRILLVLLLTIPLTPVYAEPSTRARILVLPLKIHWGEQELSPRHFFEVLEEEVEHQVPDANLVIPAPDDPRLQEVDLSRRPGTELSLEQGRRFHAPLVVSLDIRFQRKVEKRSGGDLLSVGALALITIVDEPSGAVVLEEPVAVGHADHLQGERDSPEFQEQTEALAMETARDLASLIVNTARKKKL
jgi:hypothetical protein